MDKKENIDLKKGSKNKDYEKVEEENKELNKDSKKLATDIGSVLKYFSLAILLFLIMSYISNNYIAGIGMNFIPLFLPLGKTFTSKPVLATVFHPEEIPKNDFFKQMKVEAAGEKVVVDYYELAEMGGSFVGMLKGVSGLSQLFNESNPNEVTLTPIYIANYSKSKWYQKLVLVFFGAIQILIGTATTLFSSFAYLFSGKHGYLLNVSEEKKRLANKKEYPFKDLGVSMMETKTSKPALKSGWSKLGLFFNFIYFIFVDKLTYGTRYFIEDKHSSFMDRFKYFFLLVFILIIIGQLRESFEDSSSAFIWGIGIIIVLFIFFAKAVLNPTKTPNPFANYEGLYHEIKYSAMKSNSENKDYTYDKLASDITKLKDTINQAMKNNSNKAEEIAKNIQYEKVPSIPIKDQIKEKLDKTKQEFKEQFDKIKSKFSKKKDSSESTETTQQSSTVESAAETTVETAASQAEANMNPVEAKEDPLYIKQQGGEIKVKEIYKERIKNLRKEIEELRKEMDKNNL